MRVTKRFVLPALCLFFGALALPQGQASKEYVYAADGFAISSPVAPVMQKRTREAEGGEIEAHFYLVQFESSGLIVMYAPLHPNDKRTPEQVLQDSKKGIALSKAKLISEKSVSLGKYRGVELETDDGQDHQLCRFYAIDRRMYMLAASVPSGKEFPAEVERWYKSFRIVSTTK